MTASAKIWRSAIVLALAVVALFGNQTLGAEPPRAYRRVLVPADQPHSWPRGDKSLLPIEARDFEHWVAAANEPAPTARIVEAEYQARLEDGRLVDTRGWWKVQHVGAGTARLPLDDAALPIANAKWRGPNAAPARHGWSLRANSGKLARRLEVPADGTLDFSWHLAATADSPSDEAIHLNLPVATRSRLVIELPPHQRPVVESSAILAHPSSDDQGGRWVLALPPQISHVLRIVDTRQTSEQVLAISLAQTCRYTVERTGIELQADLSLSAREAFPSEVALRLPSGFQLVTATCGDAELKWHRAGQGDADEPILLKLPPLAPARQALITLTAWSQFSVDKQQQLALPQVDGLFWTCGQIELVIDGSLSLRAVECNGCEQTAVDAGESAATDGKSLRFSAYSPAAAVSCVIGHQLPQGVAESGISLELGGSEIAGQIVSRVSVERGSLHQLDAELADGWAIDSVESRPADVVSEWYVDKSVEPPVLRIQFRRAISPESGVDLQMSARRAPPAMNAIQVGKLIPLKWRQVRTSSTLLQLRAADQFDLAIDGSWQEIAASSPSNAERKLVSAEKGGRAAYINENDPTTISLMPRKVAYEVTVQIAAHLSGQRCEQVYQLICSPRGGGIDHALVYVAPAPAEPLEWHETESGRRLHASQVPANDPRLGGLPAGGQLWRLEFGRFYARPVSVTATQSIPGAERFSLALVSLPDAAAQQGRVLVAAAGAAPTLVPKNLSPAPLPIDSRVQSGSGDELEACAVYRFQPIRFYDSAAMPELAIDPAPAAGNRQLLVSRLEIESRYVVEGTGAHRAIFHLAENSGDPLTLQFPPEVEVTGARLDRIPLQVERANRVSIPLSVLEAGEVEIEFVGRGSQITNGCRLNSPLPRGNFSAIAGEWRLQLPAGYAAQDPAREAEVGWRERLFGWLAQGDGPPFNPLDPGDWNMLWAQATQLFTSPAQAASGIELTNNVPMAMNRMDTYRFTFAAAAPAFVTVSHDETTTAVGIAIFMICAVGAQLAQLRMRSKIWLAIATATASLLLPAAWAPLATAATLGFAASAIWQRAQGANRTRAASMTLACVAILAAETPAAPVNQPEKVEIERVLVPVDADRQPVGTKYFVSTDFLQQLLAASSAADGQAEWMLVNMRCDGLLPTATKPVEVPTNTWRLTLNVDIATRDAVVELPLERGEAAWQPTASIDGIRVPMSWNSGGHGCKIQVSEPGTAEITLIFSPVKQASGPSEQIRLTLPGIAGAEVRIEGPPQLKELESNGATLRRQNRADISVWHGELDGTGQLELAWNNAPAREATETRPQASQLQLLNIHPGGVTAELILTQPGDSEWPEMLTLALDDAWQFSSDNSLQLEPATAAPLDPRQFAEFTIPPAARTARQLRLKFVSENSSPLGRIRPPNIDFVSVKPTERWLAVACDASLECQPSAAVAASPGLPAILATTLNLGEGRAPAILMNADQVGPDWHLAVQPVRARSTTRDRLSIAAAADRFRVNYRVEVVPQGPDRFGWSIAVPADLAIESATALAGEESLPIDWSRDDAGQVNVFFDRPVEQAYRVELHGHLPMPTDGVLSVPRIGAVGGSRKNQVVALYRELNVAADWQFAETPPWVESGASLTAPFDDQTQFVQAFTLDAATEGNARVIVDRRPSQLSGNTLTRISLGKNGWEATWVCALVVEQGAVDELSVQAPGEWAGPFEVTPATAVQASQPQAAHGETRLSLRLPRQARAGDEIRLAICSSLSGSEGQGLSVPQIRLEAPGKRTDYLQLPASLDGEPVAWTRSGIEPAELPDSFAQPDTDIANVSSHRVVGEMINVSLRPRGTRGDSASVRLAETTAQLGADGTLLEVTRFVVSPAGLADCDMHLLAGRSLIRTEVNGRPALVREIAPRRVAVQFRHPQLPQTLEVVTRSNASKNKTAKQVELRQPLLKEPDRALTVDLSLWTLRGDFDSRVPIARHASAASAAELAALRLDWWNNLSQRASGAVLDVPAADGHSWLAKWATELQSVARLAEQADKFPAARSTATQVTRPEGNAAPDPVTQSAQWIEQMAELFDSSAEALTNELAEARDSSGPRPVLPADAGDAYSFVSDGGSGSLTVEFASPRWSADHSRYLALVSLAALAAATFALTRRPEWIAWAENWPEFWGLAAGLAAWLWLRPSVVGLAVAAISAVLLIRRVRRERKSPRHGSSKLPNSIPEELA